MAAWAEANRAILITSGAIVAVTLVATVAVRLLIGRSVKDVDLRQRLRNGATFLFVAVVVSANLVLWFEQISQTFLALTALAAAFVLAAKELILCVTGGTYRALVAPYRIGDRIEVQGVMGDVVDAGLLSTTLFEVRPAAGQGHRTTGRFITVPHSALFTGPVHNNTRNRFNWKEFSLRVSPEAPWRALEAALLELARCEYAPIKAEMESAVVDLQSDFAWRPPPSEPAVFVSFDEQGLVALTVRFPVRVRHGRMSEDRIARALLERFPAEAFRRGPLGGLGGGAPGPAE